MMHPIEQYLRNLTRRQFFGKAAQSALGAAALSSLLTESCGAASTPVPDPGALGRPHHRPRARRVIYLHMMGGPSHLDLWDYKPRLRKDAGKDLRKMPEVYNYQRITGTA